MISRARPGRTAESRQCANCGEPYLVEVAYARLRNPRFCSLSCVRAAKAPKVRTCAWCKREFTPPNPGRIGTGRFCGQPCWRAYEYDRRPRSFEFTCRMCGERFVAFAAQIRKFGKPKFCSRACANQARVRLGSSVSRGPGWRKLAETIRERDGRKCVRCGAGESPNRRHSVDHFLPWLMLKDVPEQANDPDNLATLCSRCHGVKTTKIEPRLLKGDLLSLQEFYGADVMIKAMARLPARARSLGLVR